MSIVIIGPVHVVIAFVNVNLQAFNGYANASRWKISIFEEIIIN